MRYYIRHVRTGKYVRASFGYGADAYTNDKREAVKPNESQVHDLLRRLRECRIPVTFEAIK